jgi:2-methylcitrate dehydratase PrpD
MAAQYSLPFAVGATLAYGSHRYDSYREDRLEDPAILSLADRVACAADAEIEAHNAAEDAADASRIERRRRATLSELSKIDLLPEWDGLVAARHRKAAAKLLLECVAALRKLDNPTRTTKLAVIEKTVDRINAWNERANVIETPEREGLCAAIDDIGRAAGLRGNDLAAPYRDW